MNNPTMILLSPPSPLCPDYTLQSSPLSLHDPYYIYESLIITRELNINLKVHSKGDQIILNF